MVFEYPNPPIGSRPIPSAPGYRICDGGALWGCRPSFGKDGPVPWHIVRPSKPRKSGHIPVRLWIDGKEWQTYAHRLVLETFVGPCPPGMEACHNDGDPSNNYVSNLRWDTHENNAADTVKHGRSNKGERCPNSRLVEGDIPVICCLHRDGNSMYGIAKRYGVCINTIRKVVRRETWAHVAV